MYGDKKYSAMTLELNASDARGMLSLSLSRSLSLSFSPFPSFLCSSSFALFRLILCSFLALARSRSSIFRFLLFSSFLSGIDVVRNQIQEFAGTRQLFSSGVKLVILDEADAMTNDAQFALRRIIEKYTKNTRFCLICNYVSKIIPALQSRCTRFRFAPLLKEQIRSKLNEVAVAEKVNMTDNGTEAILALSGGDMRRVLNLLQSTALAYDVIDERNVYLTSGAPLPADMLNILDSLMNKGFKEAYEFVWELCREKGYALADVIKDLTEEVVHLELPGKFLGDVLDGMSNVEHRLAFGTDEKMQLASLVGEFVKARQSL
jgi:replication factor C subunit 3/5